MNNRLLKRCGEALYGPRWQTEVARDLNVADRTMRRWIAGTNDVPDGVHAELIALCQKRVAELDKLIKILPREIS
jgi:hypothetical protein